MVMKRSKRPARLFHLSQTKHSIRCSGIGFIAVFASLMTAVPGLGAERVKLDYGGLSVEIATVELGTFATTGQVPDRLTPYMALTNPLQMASFRELLNQRLIVSDVSVSQFTHSPVGERLLNQAGQLFQSTLPEQRIDALRQAMIQAAKDKAGLTLLNVIRKFPENTVKVNVPLALSVIQENAEIFQRRTEVVTQIHQQEIADSLKHPVTIPPQPQLSRPGAIQWTKQTFTFQNPARTRRSNADLYLPSLPKANTGDIPVIVISHGLASNRSTFIYLATHLASHGFAIVVLEHLETSSEKFVRFLNGFEGAPDPSELTSRPRDITAVLDTLTQTARSDPALQKLNLREIGLFGHSLGGYTVLAAAGASINRLLLQDQCKQTLSEHPSLNLSMLIQCRILELPQTASLAVQDNRVKAVIAINPLTSSIFGQAGLSQIQSPILLLASTDDFFAPALPEQIEPFSWLTTPTKYLVIAHKATHFSFLGQEKKSVLPIPPGFIGPNPALAYPAFKAMSLAFFKRHLLNQPAYDIYLSESYFKTLNQNPFVFDIIQSLDKP